MQRKPGCRTEPWLEPLFQTYPKTNGLEGKPYDIEIYDAHYFLCHNDCYRLLLPQTCHRCKQFRSWWAQRWPMAYGFRLWNVLLFRCYFCWLRWAVWLEIRHCFYLDWHWQRLNWAMLAWVILGRRTRIMTQHLNSATMPEFFGRRFHSNGLKIGASAIVFIFLIPYTASLYNGLSRLFGMAFEIDYTVCILIMAVLTGIYVIAGGYMATAINDFLQGIVMLFGIAAVIAAVLKGNGGFLEALNQLARISDTTVSTQPGVFASFFGPDPANLLGVVILTSLGTWGLPQMVQKFYAIKSEKSIKKGTIISTLFAIIVSGGCYFLGGFGRLYSHSVDIASQGYDAIIPAMVSNLSPALIGLVVILVLSASMSTLSSLVMASSSTLTIDFLKDNVIKDMDEKKQLLAIRVLIVVFIAISVIIAIIQYKGNITFIAQLMGVSWGALAGAFLAPFLYGLYWKKTTAISVWASFLFGAGFMICNMLLRSHFPTMLQSPINAGAFAMLAGLVLVPVISLFTPKLEKSFVDAAFSCYERKTQVTVKSDLGE